MLAGQPRSRSFRGDGGLIRRTARLRMPGRLTVFSRVLLRINPLCGCRCRTVVGPLAFPTGAATVIPRSLQRTAPVLRAARRRSLSRPWRSCQGGSWTIGCAVRRTGPGRPSGSAPGAAACAGDCGRCLPPRRWPLSRSLHRAGTRRHGRGCGEGTRGRPPGTAVGRRMQPLADAVTQRTPPRGRRFRVPGCASPAGDGRTRLFHRSHSTEAWNVHHTTWPSRCRPAPSGSNGGNLNGTFNGTNEKSPRRRWCLL